MNDEWQLVGHLDGWSDEQISVGGALDAQIAVDATDARRRPPYGLHDSTR
jgi:hypothetical protein